jgi:hypothetical protein
MLLSLPRRRCAPRDDRGPAPSLSLPARRATGCTGGRSAEWASPAAPGLPGLRLSAPDSAVADFIVCWDEVREGDLTLHQGQLTVVTGVHPDRCGRPEVAVSFADGDWNRFAAARYTAVRRYLAEAELGCPHPAPHLMTVTAGLWGSRHEVCGVCAASRPVHDEHDQCGICLDGAGHGWGPPITADTGEG